jgi:hypothetical protein
LKKVHQITNSNRQLKRAKGCADFEIVMKDLGIPGSNYQNKIHFNANVTEDGTGIIANSTSSITISYELFEFDLIEPLYYKPGIEFKSRIKVKSKDGHTIPKTERFKIEMKNKDFVLFTNDSMTVDSDGFIEFNFDPTLNCKSECKTIANENKPPILRLRIDNLKQLETVFAHNRLREDHHYNHN